jgi:hypothetical protein
MRIWSTVFIFGFLAGLSVANIGDDWEEEQDLEDWKTSMEEPRANETISMAMLAWQDSCGEHIKLGSWHSAIFDDSDIRLLEAEDLEALTRLRKLYLDSLNHEIKPTKTLRVLQAILEPHGYYGPEVPTYEVATQAAQVLALNPTLLRNNQIKRILREMEIGDSNAWDFTLFLLNFRQYQAALSLKSKIMSLFDPIIMALSESQENAGSRTVPVDERVLSKLRVAIRACGLSQKKLGRVATTASRAVSVIERKKLELLLIDVEELILRTKAVLRKAQGTINYHAVFQCYHGVAVSGFQRANFDAYLKDLDLPFFGDLSTRNRPSIDMTKPTDELPPFDQAVKGLADIDFLILMLDAPFIVDFYRKAHVRAFLRSPEEYDTWFLQIGADFIVRRGQAPTDPYGHFPFLLDLMIRKAVLHSRLKIPLMPEWVESMSGVE